MSAQDGGPNAHLTGVAGSRAALSTPALLLDIDAMQRNIAKMAVFAADAGVSVRPHAKGSKSVEIVRRQVAAGAIGVCCTTIGEAEVMGAAGLANILISSPVVAPEMISRLIRLNELTAGLLVVVDDPRNVTELAVAIGTSGRPLGVLVEFTADRLPSASGPLSSLSSPHPASAAVSASATSAGRRKWCMSVPCWCTRLAPT